MMNGHELNNQGIGLCFVLALGVAFAMASCCNPAVPSSLPPIVERAADIDAAGDGAPAGLTVYNGLLYFSARDSAHGTQLWSYNGTAATRVSDINPPDGAEPLLYPTVYDDGSAARLYFRASDGSSNNLYHWDGSSVGTVAGLYLPQFMTVYGGALYMGAYDTVANGEELWSCDGTAGTLRADINVSVNGSSFPSYLTVFNGKLYFKATDGSGYKLWRYDGSSHGLAVGATVASHGMRVYNGALYFCATDGVTGYELWRYDGVSVPTGPVVEVNPGAGNGLDQTGGTMVVFDGKLYFRGTADGVNWKLYEYDGSSVRAVSDTKVAATDMAVWGGALYYSGNDGTAGWELWSWDGTSAGMVKDINAGVGSSNPQQFCEYGTRLYFQADDGPTGAELWMVHN